MSSMRDSQFRRPDIGTIGASLLVMVGFAVYLAGRYLGSLPGYQYNGPIPPDIAYSIMGFYSAIVGIVILTARFLWQVFALPARGRIALLAGWSLVIAGLVAMPTGALQETTCSNCYFNLNGSFVIFWAGAVALPAGLTVVASVLLASPVAASRPQAACPYRARRGGDHPGGCHSLDCLRSLFRISELHQLTFRPSA